MICCALRPLLVWSLATCLLLVSALVYPQTVPHAAHHAHHGATTHGSALCSWLCAAGQGLDSLPITVPGDAGPVVQDRPATVEACRPSPLSILTTRGPPLAPTAV